MSWSLKRLHLSEFRIFLLVFLFMSPVNLFSQTRAVLLEPEFEVNISTESRWSYSFGIANRGILIETIDGVKHSDYNNEHIELNHWNSFKTGENAGIALGIRYRFREIFDAQKEDELRIVEQFSSKHGNSFIGWDHRVRFEQRFRNPETIFRLRYQFGLSKPISQSFSFNLSTEALYSVSKHFKPQPEQRVGFGIENTSFDRWELSLGLEYRMDNYIRNQENELFILTGAALNL